MPEFLRFASSGGFVRQQSCLAGLLDHCQRAIALRTESFHGVRIECGSIGSLTNGKCRDDLPVSGAQNYHRVRIATGREQDLIPCIQCQAGACATPAAKIKMIADRHRLGVDYRDGVLVLNINVDVPGRL